MGIREHTTPYMKQRALGRKAKEFYKIACPYCEAPIGKACWQRSKMASRGVDKYIAPHASRVYDTLKAEAVAKVEKQL